MSLHLITGYAGQNHITAADNASFNIGLLGSGNFVLDKGNKFEATIISNNLIRILDGDLIIQGRHVRLAENTYEELVIENGTQGMYRNDLIVARYEKDATTGIEKCEFKVLKGEESATKGVDPNYTTGDITEQGNALVTEYPLYRIRLNGLNIEEVAQMFRVEKLLGDAVVPKSKTSTIGGIGWYRIAKMKCGSISEANGGMNNSCDIEIKRSYNSKLPEYKSIQLLSAYQSTTFCNETSKAELNANLINKIRHTVDTATNTTYIEIYYNSDTSNGNCITLSNYKNVNNRKWELIEPELTSETVEGVTVLGSHNFVINSNAWNLLGNGASSCDISSLPNNAEIYVLFLLPEGNWLDALQINLHKQIINTSNNDMWYYNVGSSVNANYNTHVRIGVNSNYIALNQAYVNGVDVFDKTGMYVYWK